MPEDFPAPIRKNTQSQFKRCAANAVNQLDEVWIIYHSADGANARFVMTAFFWQQANGKHNLRSMCEIISRPVSMPWIKAVWGISSVVI